MVKNTLNKVPGDEYTTDDHNKGGTGEVVNYVISAGGTPDANRLDQLQEWTMSYAGGKLNAMFYQDNGSSGTHQLVRPAGALSTYTNDLTNYVDGLEVKFVSNFAHDGTSLVNINVRNIGDVPLTGSDSGITYEQGSVLSCLYYSGAFKLLSLDAATSFVNSKAKLRAVLETQIGEIVANLNPAYQNLSSYNDGVFEYLLLDGQPITALAYPILNGIYGSNVPDLSDGGFLRHIDVGSGRNLGDFQDWAIKRFEDDTVVVTRASLSQKLEFPVIEDSNGDYFTMFSGAGGLGPLDSTASLRMSDNRNTTFPFLPGVDGRIGFSGLLSNRIQGDPTPYSNDDITVIKVDSVTTKDYSSIVTQLTSVVPGLNPENGGTIFQASTDEYYLNPDGFTAAGWNLDPNETRPANTAVQYYVKAKVVF